MFLIRNVNFGMCPRTYRVRAQVTDIYYLIEQMF